MPLLINTSNSGGSSLSASEIKNIQMHTYYDRVRVTHSGNSVCSNYIAGYRNDDYADTAIVEYSNCDFTSTNALSYNSKLGKYYYVQGGLFNLYLHYVNMSDYVFQNQIATITVPVLTITQSNYFPGFKFCLPPCICTAQFTSYAKDANNNRYNYNTYSAYAAINDSSIDTNTIIFYRDAGYTDLLFWKEVFKVKPHYRPSTYELAYFGVVRLGVILGVEP